MAVARKLLHAIYGVLHTQTPTMGANSFHRCAVIKFAANKPHASVLALVISQKMNDRARCSG